MEEPAWNLLKENLPEHLRSHFVYMPGKVTVRGLGVLKVEGKRLAGKGFIIYLCPNRLGDCFSKFTGWFLTLRPYVAQAPLRGSQFFADFFFSAEPK